MPEPFRGSPPDGGFRRMAAADKMQPAGVTMSPRPAYGTRTAVR